MGGIAANVLRFFFWQGAKTKLLTTAAALGGAAYLDSTKNDGKLTNKLLEKGGQAASKAFNYGAQKILPAAADAAEKAAEAFWEKITNFDWADFFSKHWMGIGATVLGGALYMRNGVAGLAVGALAVGAAYMLYQNWGKFSFNQAAENTGSDPSYKQTLEKPLNLTGVPRDFVLDDKKDRPQANLDLNDPSLALA